MTAEDLREAVRRLGARFDDDVLQATQALYAPWRCGLPAGCEVQRDVPYGEHPRQRLDLYRPAGNTRAPLLLYVPGGGFTGGDKDGGDGVYANLGGCFAAQGWQVAVMNYRLAPDHPWPAGSEDVAQALEGLLGHLPREDGTAPPVAAIGQSAGAAHLAGVLFDARWAATAARLQAAVLMSGFYDPQPPLRPGPQAYYGAADPLRSPLRLACATALPLLLTVAEFDPAGIARQTLQLADRLTELNGRCPPLLWHAGHNHVSTVLSLGTPQDDVVQALQAFLQGATPAGPAR